MEKETFDPSGSVLWRENRRIPILALSGAYVKPPSSISYGNPVIYIYMRFINTPEIGGKKLKNVRPEVKL